MTADPREALGGISCADFVELVTDYLEGAMPPPLRARFDVHLAGCEGCAAYLDQMRETLRLTGVLREEAVPGAGRERLLDAFRTWRRDRSHGDPSDR